MGCERRPGGGLECCGSSIEASCESYGGPPPCRYQEDWKPVFQLCTKGVVGPRGECCAAGCRYRRRGCRRWPWRSRCKQRCCRGSRKRACSSEEGPPPCYYPRWVLSRAFDARDLDPRLYSRTLDRAGRPFEFTTAEGELLRLRIHRNAGSDGSVVALTLPFWYGCRHRYHTEVSRMAAHFLNWAQRRGEVVTEIIVHELSDAFNLPELNLHRTFATLSATGVRVRFSPDVPVCCSGAEFDELGGHSEDSPCVRLLRHGQDRLQLVRMSSASPLRSHSEGCAEDFVCPSHVNAWSVAPCCYGAVATSVMVWRTAELMPSLASRANATPLEAWPADAIVNRGLAGSFARYVDRHTREFGGGTCLLTFLRRLPEFADFAGASLVGQPAPWSQLVFGVGTCKRFYHYKFVEYAFDAAGFLQRHGVPRRYWRGIPSGELIVRFCAPAVVRFSEYTGAEHSSRCDVSTTGTDLVPFLLAFLFGAPAAFQLAPFPQPDDVRPASVPHEPADATLDTKIALYHAHHSRLLERYQSHLATHGCASAGAGASVAVCITGMARTLYRPEVYRSIRENFSASLGANVEVAYFHVWHLEEGRLAADFAAALAALPPAEPCLSCHEGPPRRLPNLTCASPSCGPQLADWWRCYSQVERYEERRGRRFDWLARLRTDSRWFAPVGAIACLDAERVHLPVAEDAYGTLMPYGTHSDRFALVPRQLARAYFGTVWEPALCKRVARLTGTFRCMLHALGFCDCQCILDLRIERLRVPVERFPVIFELVRDEDSLGMSGAYQKFLRTVG